MNSKTNTCSSCKKEITDIRINMIINVNIDKKIENDWENISKFNSGSDTLICQDCFDKIVNFIEEIKQ